MLEPQSVNLGNLLLALSDAVDLAAPSIASHQMRTAYVVWQLGIAAELPPEELTSLFTAALFHDIGALTVEEKMALHAFEVVDPDRHCVLGESVFLQSPLLAPAAPIVRQHHTPWRGSPEVPSGAVESASQMLFLADLVERLIDRGTYILHQSAGITGAIAAQSGEAIDPDVVDLFMSVSNREDFWLDLTSSRLHSLLLRSGPLHSREIELPTMFSIADVFRAIIDFRSRFTATHTAGVSEAAVTLCELLGFTRTETTAMEVAGCFHDLGKLAVPERILEKPGRLTDDEFAIMRQHTYITYTILNSVGGLGRIPEWAAFHHEKLDGSGYPFHAGERRIDIGARILAVADIFTALAEDRPYREGMQKDGIVKILLEQADRNQLDRGVVALGLDNHDVLRERVMNRQAQALEQYKKLYAGYGRRAAVERTGSGSLDTR
ncbi:MAG: HD domain-containing protein [Actinobacteria bacterium]|nr:HD domain-containing protein [Actinomycetota bacterium]